MDATAESDRYIVISTDGHCGADILGYKPYLPEAFETVERGLMDEADFRRFTFSHPCEFFAGVNSEFFSGTSIEAYAAEGLRDSRT